MEKKSDAKLKRSKGLKCKYAVAIIAKSLNAGIIAKSAEIALLLTADKSGVFLLDALMLEAHHDYANRNTASSWIPPRRRSASYTRQMYPADNLQSSITFWAKTVGSMGWRNLLSIGDNLGWRT